ncbi:hypothetical protein HO133_000431 [Letharia lupina]|uniref:ubiquitinyl hydrolase 1 n=1 Tax=Letharia lupina TaxID=560253 RepID=A0A8H6CHE9_9LECA|nr:uncharacterized protein HO133_000431 [Letharia lupina]KAF6223588.1 hypothetical protein HO133_000431 [Letharia lupina]
MSTINRFLSRKDKNSHGTHKDKPKRYSGHLNGFFEGEEVKPPEKEEEKKIKTLSQRLARNGITTFKDDDIAYVLTGAYAQGDSGKAYELLSLLKESEEGIIRDYNPNVKLLGAINREGVTCYLDALLFAMFARGSFEAMLYKNFEDAPRKRLATLLRLWVNILRAGKLITTDITKQIQLQLSHCGWTEAAELCQQDASEAFTFITSTLALPLLTFRMDIFHTGKEDTNDDHKFINERLLELAIPEEPLDGHVITLEECLEMFFNNKIEVKRYLDSLERRGTLNSIRSHQSFDSTKAHASHFEVAELDNSPPSSPKVLQPQVSAIPVSPIALTHQRHRAPSIIQEHYIDEKVGILARSPSIAEEPRGRGGRLRKEVMMPAWQFFSLIPWYTNNVPSNDAQVAAHFSSSRPILGICLKRYSMLPNGTAVKRKTHIDIPLEIGLPHFIQDDRLAEDGPAFGNFKLFLQTVVCHQGVSVESGHYISLVRSPDPLKNGEDRWMRFDDLAKERVTYTNVEQFLGVESPYLLFYQVIPIEGDPANIADGETQVLSSENPPAYSESAISRDSNVDSAVGGLSVTVPSHQSGSSEMQRPSFEIRRPSFDASASDEDPRGRSSVERRQSVGFADDSVSSANIDFSPTPNLGLGQMNGLNTLAASRRGSKATKSSSKSRPSSRVDDNRMSTSLSRLANAMSRDKLNTPLGVPTQAEDHVSKVPGIPVAASTGDEEAHDKGTLKKEAKEKSRAHRRDHQHLVKGRHKDGKPDRECSAM